MTTRNNILSAIAASALTLGAFAAPAIAEETQATAADMQSLFSGDWTKKSFKSSGTWEIYEENGSAFVKLSSEFRTRNAPDLKIFLSPLAASETTGKNATDGSVLISPLKSNAGEQIYEIPAGIDLAEFKSILIHCEAYSKLWSASDLA